VWKLLFVSIWHLVHKEEEKGMDIKKENNTGKRKKGRKEKR
jgi:hypothetical protein